MSYWSFNTFSLPVSQKGISKPYCSERNGQHYIHWGGHRPNIDAPTCFRFPIRCFSSKPKRVKGDRGSKSRLNVRFLDPPCTIRERWARCSSDWITFGLRYNLSAVCAIRGQCQHRRPSAYVGLPDEELHGKMPCVTATAPPLNCYRVTTDDEPVKQSLSWKSQYGNWKDSQRTRYRTRHIR